MTAERYTAVFTGLLEREKPGEYTYLRLGNDTLGGGGYTIDRGCPPYGALGREISFSELPENCKGVILNTYRRMWDL